MYNFNRSVLFSSISAVAIAVSPAVNSLTLEEIVVTAQKREENLQDVPIAIQAFSGDMLDQAGIDNTDDIGIVTPGVQMSQSGAASAVFIRGIGNQDGSGGQEGAVGTYVDGVWYGSVTGSALSFNNIERIEVLKGPQGTLFGRNTTGGVINVVTKSPSHETSGNISVGYGNYETFRYGLYATTGITENLAADISLFGQDQGEGFGENIVDGSDVNMREEINARTKWKYTGDVFAATFSAAVEDFSDDMGYARAVPPGSIALGGFLPLDDRQDIAHDGGSPEADNKNATLALTLDWSFDGFDLKSISAWKKDELDSFVDNDVGRLSVVNANIDFENEAITQEFQILSNDSDSDITWIMGLFLLDQESYATYTITGPAVFPAGLNDLRFFGTIETQSIAGFGEVAWHMTDATRLTVGLRYTRDEREITGGNEAFLFTDGQPFNGQSLGVAPTPKQEESWEEPTWRLVLDHQLTDDVMVYGSYNRGFRSGNYNTVAAAAPAFEPEILDAYEIGMKSDLLDQTLRLNLSAYYYEVSDLQFQTLQGVTTAIFNAAEAEIKGLDADVIWAATENLTFNMGVAYMDGEYTDFPNAQSNIPTGAGGNLPTPAIIDVTGNQVAGAPEWTANVGAQYMVMTDSGEYSVSVQGMHNGGFPWEPDGRLEQDSYTLLNLSVGWTSVDEVWGVSLTGRNLLDEDYSVTTRSQTGINDFYAAGKPLTYYVTLDYNF
jgi:iron complex outermembrane recepter protein